MGGRRYAPYAFTEHGVAMLSSVLNSPRAVQVNIEIIRAFVRLRALLASHAELGKRVDELERKYALCLTRSASSWRRRPRPRENSASKKGALRNQAHLRAGSDPEDSGCPRLAPARGIGHA